MSELDVLVVGGGVSGLAIAHCIAAAGLRVELWESDNRVGGKIQTLNKQDYRLDLAASMVMSFRREVDGFLDSAGLASSKCERSPANQRYILHAGRLRPAPASIGGLIGSPMLSPRGKLRMLAEPFMARGSDPGETVAQFVTRRLGREFVDLVFDPYLSGPLASDVERAEAGATMPKLTALEKRYGSLAVGALLHRLASRHKAARPQAFSFTGGMETLVRTLAQSGRFEVRTATPVVELWRAADGWQVQSENGDVKRRVSCRQLILCTPADIAGKLIRPLDRELSNLLAGIDYAPVNVVHTGFERDRVAHPLDGSGFLLTKNSGYVANGCLWISNLFPDRAPPGRVLLSSYLGGARNPSATCRDDNRSLDAVMPMLRDLLGTRGEPEMLHVCRHRRALPLYFGGYSQRLAAVDERLGKLPDLHLAANYIGGVSVRDRILCAASQAKLVLRRHRQMTKTPRIAGDPELLPSMAMAAAAAR